MKRPMLAYSEMTNRVYVLLDYRVVQDEHAADKTRVVAREKIDVTADFDRIVLIREAQKRREGELPAALG